MTRTGRVLPCSEPTTGSRFAKKILQRYRTRGNSSFRVDSREIFGNLPKVVEKSLILHGEAEGGYFCRQNVGIGLINSQNIHTSSRKRDRGFGQETFSIELGSESGRHIKNLLPFGIRFKDANQHATVPLP